MNSLVHDALCPSFWTEKGELKPPVREKLIEIADAFVEFLGIDADPDDVILTGSLANYSYTPESDADVHVVIDFEKAGWTKNKLLAATIHELFVAKKTVWNTEHRITVAGHPVELYAQDAAEEHIASGVYSLLDEQWIKEPSHDIPVVDYGLVRQKATGWIEIIDRALEQGDTAALKMAKERIKLMRREALHDGGEYSIGNLSFKILRREGALQKLFSGYARAYDSSLSY